MCVSGRDGLTMSETILIDASVGRIPISGFHIAPTVGFYVSACLGVARGFTIDVFFAPKLRRLNRCSVDDIDVPFSHDDVFCFKLTVHLAQQNIPQAILDQLLAEASDSCGIRYITAQFEAAKFPEQQITKQGLY